MPSTSRSSDLDSKDFSQTFPAVLLRPVGTADTAGDCEKKALGTPFFPRGTQLKAVVDRPPGHSQIACWSLILRVSLYIYQSSVFVKITWPSAWLVYLAVKNCNYSSWHFFIGT